MSGQGSFFEALLEENSKRRSRAPESDKGQRDLVDATRDIGKAVAAVRRLGYVIEGHSDHMAVWLLMRQRRGGIASRSRLLAAYEEAVDRYERRGGDPDLLAARRAIIEKARSEQ